MILVLLVVLLVLATCGAPIFPYNQGWRPYGWYPSGLLGIVLIILLILLLLGHVGGLR